MASPNAPTAPLPPAHDPEDTENGGVAATQQLEPAVSAPLPPDDDENAERNAGQEGEGEKKKEKKEEAEISVEECRAFLAEAEQQAQEVSERDVSRLSPEKLALLEELRKQHEAMRGQLKKKLENLEDALKDTEQLQLQCKIDQSELDFLEELMRWDNNE